MCPPEGRSEGGIALYLRRLPEKKPETVYSLNILFYKRIGLDIKKGSGYVKLGIGDLSKDAVENSRQFGVH
jgi:hypothetical protein